MAEVDIQYARSDGPDTTLVVDLDAWPLSLDPFHVVDFNQATVLDALVDPLTRDRADGPGTEPSALVSVTPSDGPGEGHTWLLRPAPGQRWGDGSPVRPEEIAAGVHRAWGPTCLPLPAAHDPHGTGSPVTTRVVPDPDDGAPVVELRSALPLPYLPQLLAFPGAAPVRETPDGGWTASGPFRPVLADRARGRIELRRKPSRRTGPGTPRRLAFQVYADRSAAFAALADGRLDLSVNTGLTPDRFTEAAARPGATVRALSMACQLWVRPGLDSPLATPAGRRAFSAGFDRRSAGARLCGAALPLPRYSALWEPRAGGSDDGGPAGPSLPGRLPPPGRRAELALSYADFAPNGEAAALVASDLQARFGHPVRLRPLSYEAFARAAATLDYELLYAINPAPLAHVAGFLTGFHSTAGQARALGFAEPAVDAALDRALGAAGGPESEQAWREAEAVVLDHAPVVPLFQVNSVTLTGPGHPAPAVAATGALPLDDLTRTAVPGTHAASLDDLTRTAVAGTHAASLDDLTRTAVAGPRAASLADPARTAVPVRDH
ncbi:ABC transporter substrate-binding protein [Streptomyces sp. NPDC096079]|uniref:ABC transporter substrate-binding protein n=1 Tax=Streptomyces sp. NPDC096079 TaxID=3155820 RepID=UPI0033331AD7